MDIRKIALVTVLILIAVVSFTRIAPWAADPQTHVHSIEQTEEKISTVMTLSGGAAATSATLSLLPGDMCTPIAEQLAELAKYFLLILSALYLEKFMIWITGFVTFSLFIPFACLILCGAVIFGKKNWITIAGKIAFIGIVLFLIVPASVKLSDMVYQTQAERVNNTVEEYNELNIEGETGGGLLGELTTITSNTVDRVTIFLSGLLESLAVMIVTACIIPILVFVFLIWIVKTVFSSNVLTIEAGEMASVLEKFKKQ
ncbi:hypothetical protein [Butyrivibrio sp. WCE2006]|uniref:hypothetical protein n=1 Tax=Butyrivibrio sp. WCE2006 TaxID=1410611 RepID=UPI0005D19302|nr:hypothetical protein [Butyrivibrio sp. WCE2006]